MASTKPKVFVTRSCPETGIERLRQYCDVTIYGEEGSIPLDVYKSSIAGIDALIVHPPTPVNGEILDVIGPQLKVVATVSVGLDHIDLEECKKREVKVGYTPEVLTTAVAEMAVTLTMAAARRVQEGIRAVRDGVWGTRWENALWLAGKEISGSVVGIVGLGRIGLATAKILHGFKPSSLLYCANGRKESGDAIGAKFVTLDQLLQESDFVIATCALNASTTGLFGREAFQKMKNDSVFVNVTRGALVDQEALYEALTTNQIGAAAIDVSTPEPLPTNHKLLSLPNLLITPHISSASLPARNGMCELTVKNLLAGLEGRPLPKSAY